MRMISTKEVEITNAVSTIEMQLDEANARLNNLHLVLSDEVDMDLDQTSARSQVEMEKFALQQSLNLLGILNDNVQSAAKDVRRGQRQVINTISFGINNKGIQNGINNAPIRFSIGRDEDD